MANDLIERADSVRATWQMALDKGYFDQAITDYTVPQFSQFIGGLIPGLLMALMVPVIGQVGGSIAGAALGSLIGPEGTVIGGRAGQVLGGAAASFILLKWGLEFIRDFILPKVGMVGEHLSKGVSQAWDAGGWGPSARARLQDEAAREIATGIGVLFGLLLMGLVLVIIKDPVKGLTKLRNSFLGRTCTGLVDWIQNNVESLKERYRNGPTRIQSGGAGAPTALERAQQRWGQAAVIEGGLDPKTQTSLDSARSTVKQVLPFVIGTGRTVSPGTLAELDGRLTQRFGFRLIRADPYGPNEGKTGWQLFWQKGNVLVRFKTTGENAGPRKGIPHLSIGFNDGKGLDWQNDLAKFTYDGKVVAKVITNPEKFNPTDFQGNPQKFVLLPTAFDMAAVDEWAAKTHFNVEARFTLDGLQAILQRAPARH